MSEAKERDEGPAFQILVRLCGLGALAALILPYFTGMSVVDLAKLIGEEPGNTLALFGGGQGAWSTVFALYLILGLLLIVMLSMAMVFRGRYVGGPMTFVIVFNAAGWLFVNFLGDAAGVPVNWFSLMGLGFYLACGAFILPLLGMFFLDKSI